MATPENPLASFTKLGPSVYMQDPVEPTKPGPVIFIAFWLNALPRTLAKYLVAYRQLVPSARIIFVGSSSTDLLWHSTARAQQARVAPAVEALRASASLDNPVFVHFFSNGGLFTISNVLQAYKAATGTPLPISSMIVDSAPGTASIPSSVTAISYALPDIWLLRLVGKGFMYLFLSLAKLVQTLTRSLDPITLANRVINDPTLVQAVNSKGALARCYLYSDVDGLIDPRDVEKHADESEAQGLIVRRELFKGAPHVGLMRAAPDRYWGVINEYLVAFVSP
ncbi:Protein of unknown function DUF829 TMEM53 [Penicillium alfredii]|uniref:Indole-diterpene biosynthesis protein PaxU n=1 Tax=Penicillium alfredii TaxID=1506179 RepID=A0A9W9GAW1_9EURO|nr:Protein of unknown function DUF829 TMEM53 [Penicillium alfredii]KAJ5115281.1 Protein of unknown function DUF829 TMEM53 [Penicillium alfredii]